MPARRNPKKIRTPKTSPSVTELTPPDLDQLAVTPVSAPPLDAAPAARPVAPKAGPPVAHGRSAGGRGGQRSAQPRRYAFRRS
ncbi:hypothetical protein ACFOOK_07355 [Micromonospora krabiensis]|uniref:Uncharacterized protein n=1 Tax=Micromonospora krabiensis TaxID=307121 RepID=A0A1C3NC66_9ACTN|nr:hypothetical protein [Micromonospora krabiensis]SBV30186.1 hypothetical protein GA0070620_5779 [Micromonospora krabiensis]